MEHQILQRYQIGGRVSLNVTKRALYAGLCPVQQLRIVDIDPVVTQVMAEAYYGLDMGHCGVRYFYDSELE